jgi:predicted nucleic acid-binding protein
MKLYLDMCVWKRPFDDQSDDRIWIESQAVIRIFNLAYSGDIQIFVSMALTLENDHNPKAWRRYRVAALMASFGRPMPLTNAILRRAYDIRALGFMDMDALHLAFAEHFKATYFVTTDDMIFKRQGTVKTKIINPVDLLKEHIK